MKPNLNPAQFAQARTLFEAACELAADEQAVFIEGECADPDVRRAVLRLLAIDASDIVLNTVGAGSPDLAPVAAVPDRVGLFRIIRLIGRGGMGAVYEAEQDHPRRRVALKIVHPGIMSPSVLQRFAVEAEVLGRLQHPGIAQIHDAGTFDAGAGGQPYFAMELIDGLPLTEYAEAHRLDARERLRLLVRICSAVHHAHQRGVIHRDLKPGNILVTRLEDGTDQPKILDFGVARSTDGDVRTTTLRTDVGQLIGTIAYMSPEQASGDPALLDTRSDVYALGVLAYELLAGRLPYPIGDRMIHDAVRVIREEPPTRLGSIDRSFRGDVETIVGKALEKDPERRYESAAQLAADIERALNDEPIVARPASAIYQMRKFAQRHRAVVVAALSIAAVLVVATVVSVVLAVVAIEARSDSEEAAGEAEARARELQAVTEFQAAQLDDLDPRAMGLRMRDALVLEAETALVRGNEAPEQAAARLAELDALVAELNFTNLALEALDDTVFRRSLAAIEEQFGDQPLVTARLLQALGSTLRNLGLYEQADVAQTEALAIRRERLGDDDPLTLRSIGETSLLRRRMGELDEAERLHREMLERCRRMLGNDHPMTLKAIQNMGLLLFVRGRLDEAAPYTIEALEAKERLLGDDDPGTLSAVRAMGSLRLRQERYGDAEAHYRRALEGRRRAFGSDHPETLHALRSMAELFYAQQRYDEAERWYRDTLEGRRRALGDEHSETVGSIAKLGGMLHEMERFDEAEPLLREALATRRRVLGNAHVRTLGAIRDLASLLHDREELVEAEALCREALDRGRRADPDSRDILDDARRLVRVLQSRGKSDEAGLILGTALADARRIHGQEHPVTLNVIHAHGGALEEAGKVDEAEALYRTVTDGPEGVPGEESRAMLRVAAALASLLREQGRPDEAEPYCRVVAEGTLRLRGPDHRETLTRFSSLGHALRSQGKWIEAEAVYRTVLEGRRRALGPDHLYVLNSQAELTRALIRLERFQEAEALALDHEARNLQKHGPTHAERLKSVERLVIPVYEAWHAAEPEAGYDASAETWRAELAPDQETPNPEP